MPTLTNTKHEAFCRAIGKGKSNTDAYIAAGYEYSSRAAAGRYAYRLRKREDIAQRIEELTGKTKGRIAVAQVANAIKTGRPTLYREELCQMAKNLALLGLTDDGVARAMNIAPSNLYAWKSQHPPFRRALEDGREIAHAQVAASLHQKATGFTRIGKKVAQSKAGPVVVEVEEYHPPDTAAASFWLRNRAPDYWKERREVNVEASFEHRFSTMTIEERRADARALAEQVRRALLEATQTIDGEAEEIVEPPSE